MTAPMIMMPARHHTKERTECTTTTMGTLRDVQGGPMVAYPSCLTPRAASRATSSSWRGSVMAWLQGVKACRSSIAPVRPMLAPMMLLTVRLAAKISQAELAVRMGIDRAYIRGLEQGQRNPTVVTLWHLAKALGVAMRAFFDEKPRRTR
jgi:DNA-binding XRE family transcriptional regulator